MVNILLIKFRTINILWIALVLICIIMQNERSALAQVSSPKVSKSQFGYGLKGEHQRSLTDLTNEADLIAVGKVNNLTSEWDENKTRIRTRVTISNDETIKGTSPGSSITIIIPGGEIDGVGELYSHSVQFKKEEDVIVFVKKDKMGHFIVSDGERGKFSIVKDKDSGKKIIPNVGSLESFTDQIKNTLKTNHQDKNNK